MATTQQPTEEQWHKDPSVDALLKIKHQLYKIATAFEYFVNKDQKEEEERAKELAMLNATRKEVDDEGE